MSTKDIKMDKTNAKNCGGTIKKTDNDIQKFAAGGVGKIRHKEATMSGKPINPKRHTRKGMM